MYRLILLFISMAFVLLIHSCGEENCPNIDGVRVTNLLYLATKNNAYNYCDLVNKSIKGNDMALKELCLLKIDDAAGYDHGALIIDIINIIGESKFVAALQGITKKEKGEIKSYLIVGLEYGNKYPESSDLDQIFPEIASYLTD